MWERAVIAIAVCAASPAGADTTAVDKLASEAAAAAAAADYATAAAKFRAAYAADPRPELQCNAGVAYYKLGDLARADRYLGDCVERASGLAADFVSHVHAALAAVEDALHTRDATPVDIAVEPATATVTVDLWPDEPFVGSHRVWLGFGHHQVSVAAPGYATQAVGVDAQSHDPVAVHVVLDKLPPPPTVVGGLGFAGAAASPPAPTIDKVLVFGGAGLAVVGVGLHIAAYHYRDELYDAATLKVYNSDAGPFEALRAATISCYAVAAIAGGVGGYLWYRHHRAREHAPAVGVTLMPGGAGVGVTWQR
jgi:tetratricopeptide (TPR) repeat protein